MNPYDKIPGPLTQSIGHIYLTGYRATGKSSVGRLLAKCLQRPFTDLDQALEQHYALRIPDIVSTSGWAVFREYEKNILAKVARQPFGVVATGGGVVLAAENRQLLQQTGNVIWLTAAPATIARRLQASAEEVNNRPALTAQGTLAEIETVLAERLPLYQEVAAFQIPTDNLTIDAVCESIISFLQSETLVLYS